MHDYLNRREAGAVLAEALSAYRNKKDVIVLALPRGGVPVAFEVANALRAPLDLYIVRKLGVPGHHELAMGAISAGVTVFNDEIIKNLKIEQEEIDAVTEFETKELQRREAVYRGNQPPPFLKNKTVLLIDDGIATGATIKAAIESIRHQNPTRLVAAVPVADKHIQKSIQDLVDEFICPLIVDQLNSVGAWYNDFSQTEDAEVHDLMRQARQLNQR